VVLQFPGFESEISQYGLVPGMVGWYSALAVLWRGGGVGGRGQSIQQTSCSYQTNYLMELEVTGKHTDGAEAGAIAGGNAIGAGLLMEGR
jgi:hypothetical protein